MTELVSESFGCLGGARYSPHLFSDNSLSSLLFLLLISLWCSFLHYLTILSTDIFVLRMSLAASIVHVSLAAVSKSENTVSSESFGCLGGARYSPHLFLNNSLSLLLFLLLISLWLISPLLDNFVH